MADNIRVYKDLDLNFTPHPITGDIVKKTGTPAVISAVRNLILTNFYERPFHPEKGSHVRAMLFEPAGPLTANFIRKSIEEVIRLYEPRVTINSVVVSPAQDDTVYNIDISFFVENQPTPYNVQFFLERVR